MKKVLFTLAIIALVAFYSCDVIDPPYDDGGIVIPPDTTERNKMILLEDYTGFKCPNCPAAADEAYRLSHEVYKDKIIVLAIHSGGFADPDKEHTLDLRCDDGIEITNQLGLMDAPRPVFTLNRTEFDNSIYVFKNQAEGKIADMVDDKAKVKLDFEVNTASTVTNIKFDITLKYFEDQNANENIVLYLIEDGIVGYQNIEGVDHHDYVHNHVMRGSANGAFGKKITEYTGETIKADETKSFSIDYTFDASTGWVPANMKVIAAIINTTNNEVLQCNEIHLVD
jgi:Outer membrane protein Omp28